MTRSEAIAIITAALPSLDDEGISAVAGVIQSMTDPVAAPLRVSDEERAAIERSKDDFRAGRTYSLSEARAMTDAFLASRGVPKSTP